MVGHRQGRYRISALVRKLLLFSVGMFSTHWRAPHLSPTEARSLDVLARLAADLINRSLGEKERELLYLGRYVRSEQREKQPTGRGPEGCVENGPAAMLLVGYVSI